jgi:hypothetical protein
MAGGQFSERLRQDPEIAGAVIADLFRGAGQDGLRCVFGHFSSPMSEKFCPSGDAAFYAENIRCIPPMFTKPCGNPAERVV